jgi:hypothetical protein
MFPVRLACLVLCGLLLSPTVPAAMREPMCARHENINGWSRFYRVDTLVVRGFELNQARGRLQFNPASLFAVLVWDEQRLTAVELDLPVMPPVGQAGRDEVGKRWEIKPGVKCE